MTTVSVLISPNVCWSSEQVSAASWKRLNMNYTLSFQLLSLGFFRNTMSILLYSAWLWFLYKLVLIWHWSDRSIDLNKLTNRFDDGKRVQTSVMHVLIVDSREAWNSIVERPSVPNFQCLFLRTCPHWPTSVGVRLLHSRNTAVHCWHYLHHAISAFGTQTYEEMLGKPLNLKDTAHY